MRMPAHAHLQIRLAPSQAHTNGTKLLATFIAYRTTTLTSRNQRLRRSTAARIGSCAGCCSNARLHRIRKSGDLFSSLWQGSAGVLLRQACSASQDTVTLQGLYAAMGMAGIAAADNGKTEYAANISADLVRLGWGVLVAKMCVACLHLGHKHQVIEMGAVLAKQRDWHVLRKTGDCLGEIGAKEEAANLRAALAEHGLEELIGAVTHQPVSKTVQQASHEASKATAKAATTAGAVGRAVASGAESLLPGESARQTEEEHCWKFWPEDKQSEVWQTAGRVSAWVMRAADVAMWQFGHAITGAADILAQRYDPAARQTSTSCYAFLPDSDRACLRLARRGRCCIPNQSLVKHNYSVSATTERQKSQLMSCALLCSQ